VTLRIGIDTGGTFTDFVVSAPGRPIQRFKVPSTPDDPSRAVLEGLRRIAPPPRAEVLHGTTVATNALLQRRGARTAFVTTEGFRDLVEIGRGERARLYDLEPSRPAPLVPRALRFEVRERTLADGSIERRPSRAALARLAARLRRARVESVAVGFLFSFLRPGNERAAARALRTLGVPVTESHRVLLEYREMERFSTALVNAFLRPLMTRALADLARRVAPARLSIMQSSGGLLSAARAAQEPVRVVLSGPAAGAVAAARVGAAAGFPDVLALDMGGTSTDVSVSSGEPALASESVVAGCPVRLPMLDLHTVGAGGGSIACVDPAGALRVGPESAGADPGPAAYGRGGVEPTVTDANVLLGRLPEDHPLGGMLRLDRSAAERALRRLGRAVGLPPARAALGVLAVVNSGMERAMRVLTLERGRDPRALTLVPFGGAAGLHACALAEALRLPRVLIPRDPGVVSALGLLLADATVDRSRTALLSAREATPRRLRRLFLPLEAEVRAELRAAGHRRFRLRRRIDLRYRGQSHELTIDDGPDPARAFAAAHRAAYGFDLPDRPVEVVTLRARGVASAPRPRPGVAPRGARLPRPLFVRPVHLGPRAEGVAFFRREELPAGPRLEGPAILLEETSTTLVAPGFRARHDLAGNLVLERRR